MGGDQGIGAPRRFLSRGVGERERSGLRFPCFPVTQHSTEAQEPPSWPCISPRIMGHINAEIYSDFPHLSCRNAPKDTFPSISSFTEQTYPSQTSPKG